jgi:hypothetical protein
MEAKQGPRRLTAVVVDQSFIFIIVLLDELIFVFDKV